MWRLNRHRLTAHRADETPDPGESPSRAMNVGGQMPRTLWRRSHANVVGVAGLVALGGVAGCTLTNQPPTPTLPPPQVAISSVAVLADGELFAVGSTGGIADAGAIARSSDGGRTWSLSRAALPALNRVSVAGTRIVVSRYCLAPSAGGEPLGPAPDSCLFASNDDGATWEDLRAGPLVDPAFVDQTYGWAHRQFPTGRGLLHTVDGGLTWSEFDTPCPAARPLLYQAVATARETGYVLCFGEATPQGQPWSLVQRLTSGEIVTLRDGNISYGDSNDLSDEFVQGFSILPDGNGFIWTSGGLYKTIDGGHSWNSVSTEGLGDGSFWGTGAVRSGDHAYLVRRLNHTAIVEYRDGSAQTLVSWPLPPRGAPPPG